MKVKEFFIISEEDIIFKILENKQVIVNLVNTFKRFNKENTNDLNKMNNNFEVSIININVILKSLNIFSSIR